MIGDSLGRKYPGGNRPFIWVIINFMGEGYAMYFDEGQVGRVFVLRLDNGEDLLKAVGQLLAVKGVSHALLHIIGALRKGQLVTGPEAPVIPPKPQWSEFSGGWEMIALGTVYPSGEGSKIHLHGSLGRGGNSLTGCLRESLTVYLVVEVIVLELIGLSVRRELDPDSGLYLPEMV